MKAWIRKHPVQAGLCSIPWLAAQAQALELTPATLAPAVPGGTTSGQAGTGAPDALALLLWAPLLLIVLLSVAALGLMIWRQNAQARRQRRSRLRLQTAARGGAPAGVALPAVLALSSASMLVAPPVGDSQATHAPAPDRAAVQREAAEAGPILAAAAKR